MALDVRDTLLIALLVLFLGQYLNQRLRFLRAYNIPEPVTGGLLASILFALIRLFGKEPSLFLGCEGIRHVPYSVSHEIGNEYCWSGELGMGNVECGIRNVSNSKCPQCGMTSTDCGLWKQEMCFLPHSEIHIPHSDDCRHLKSSTFIFYA
ncbi:MAG: sodium/glutamate symporter [Chloroflexota bacterium]|nr:sodium/glutamate symporter [Chloroflexota bacterium]